MPASACRLGNPRKLLPMTVSPNPRKKNIGGRPPKFQEPSRPITVTLPESTLEGLRQIHPDRAQAIAKVTAGALSQRKGSRPLVEIVDVAAKTGLLIIGPCEPLRRIPFLHLVEVAPSRFLLALDPGNDFKNLEIAIHDVLDDIPENDDRDRHLIQQLLKNITAMRKAERLSMAEILLISTDSKRA